MAVTHISSLLCSTLEEEADFMDSLQIKTNTEVIIIYMYYKKRYTEITGTGVATIYVS